MTSSPRRRASLKPERVRRGRHRGGIYTSRSGERVFLAYKHLGDIFRNGKGCISDAVRAEDAYWALDEGLLMEMRSKGIRVCGVIVRETGQPQSHAKACSIGLKSGL